MRQGTIGALPLRGATLNRSAPIERALAVLNTEINRANTRPYGFELILDLHDCNPETFNRTSLDEYFSELCDLIDMEKCEVHFWDDVDVPVEEQQTSPQTKGTSAVCFILTSTIVVHTLELLEAVYVNIFSCKDFDPDVAAEFSKRWFKAGAYSPTWIPRT